jgi:hypothetical protein
LVVESASLEFRCVRCAGSGRQLPACELPRNCKDSVCDEQRNGDEHRSIAFFSNFNYIYGIWTKGGCGGRTRRLKELVRNRRIGYLKTETSLPLCEKGKTQRRPQSITLSSNWPGSMDRCQKT